MRGLVKFCLEQVIQKMDSCAPQDHLPYLHISASVYYESLITLMAYAIFNFL